MAVMRAFARPMLASIFIIQGYETWQHPERYAPAAEPVVQAAKEQAPMLPERTEHSVRINGAVQCVAGSFLAVGWWPRLSAAVLAGTLVPTTLAGHRFWEIEDKQERGHQRVHFLKNLTMLGGLLIAAADTGGDPSLAWRGRHAAKTARREAGLVARTAQATGQPVLRAGQAGAKVTKAAGRTSTKAAKAAGRRGTRAGKAAGKTGARAAQGKLFSSLLPSG